MNIRVNGTQLHIERCEKLIAGTKGIYQAHIALDESWDGFAPALVFCLNGGVPVDRIPIDGVCDVPDQALEEEGTLIVGLYGVAEGKKRPVEWAQEAVRVFPGTPMDNLPAEDQELTPWDDALIQIAAKAAEAVAAKNDAVAAKDAAVTASDAAVTAKNTAVSAKDDAARDAFQAGLYANVALGAKNDAHESRNYAAGFALEAGQAKVDAIAAKTAAETAAAQAITSLLHAPVIGANDHWLVWDAVNEQYADTGVTAVGQDAPQIDDEHALSTNPWSGQK